MPNTRYIFRYHIRSMVALHDRREIQKNRLVKWNFNFPVLKARLSLADRVKRTNGVRLHAGIDIDTILEGEYENNATNLSDSIVDTFICLLSFTTVAHCEPARLESHVVLKNDGKSHGEFLVYPYSEADIIKGTPRKIDKNITNTIFEAYGKSHYKDRIIRSISWFRKCLQEENNIDQFISLWIALEVVKHILRRKLKRKIGKANEWDGIRDIFKNQIPDIDFNDIKEGRKEILHGYKEITHDLLERIRKYLEPMRKAVIYSVCNVLEVENEIAENIVMNTPRRLFNDPVVTFKGEFENLPVNDQDLFKKYPEMRITKLKKQEYFVPETGELDTKFEFDYKARLPKDTKFFIKKKQISIESELGLDTARLESQRR